MAIEFIVTLGILGAIAFFLAGYAVSRIVSENNDLKRRIADLENMLPKRVTNRHARNTENYIAHTNHAKRVIREAYEMVTSLQAMLQDDRQNPNYDTEPAKGSGNKF